MKTVASSRDRKRDNSGGADLAAAEQKVAKQKEVAKQQRPRLLKGERELERSRVRKQTAAREAGRSAARERGRAELVRPPTVVLARLIEFLPP